MAVGGKVGWGISVTSAGGTAVAASVGNSLSGAGVTDFKGAGSVGMSVLNFVETAVSALFASGVAVGRGATDLAQIFNPPKQSSNSKNGSVIRMARLRLERWRVVVFGSSIAAEF